MFFSLLPFALSLSTYLGIGNANPFNLTTEKREKLRMLTDCEHDWGPTSSKQYMTRVVRTQVKRYKLLAPTGALVFILVYYRPSSATATCSDSCPYILTLEYACLSVCVSPKDPI